MPKKKPYKTVSAGVVFEAAVLDYLHELEIKEDRPRSYIVNRIVREHAEQQGQPIPKEYHEEQT